MRPMPFVVVARPEIAPRSPAGISLKRRPQASVMTDPPKIATMKITARYHACHASPDPPQSKADAVDHRAPGDHAREAERSPTGPATSAART